MKWLIECALALAVVVWWALRGLDRYADDAEADGTG
jgi:hypothetical protein